MIEFVIVGPSGTSSIGGLSGNPVVLKDIRIEIEQVTYGREETVTVHTVDKDGRAVDVEAIDVQPDDNITFARSPVTRRSTGINMPLRFGS